MEWTQSNTDSNETEADYAMNWWKPALGGLLAAGSLVPILARRAPGRKQDARPVTRARLTTLLLKAAHLSPDSEAVQWMSAHCTAQPLVWGDLAAHWLRKEGWLHSALCAGLLLPEDRPAGQFCPDAPLPRWEGARMAVRALGLGFPAAQAATCSPGFSDQAQFPAGTAGYALTAVQTGILPGHTGGRFHPRAPLSQTEADNGHRIVRYELYKYRLQHGLPLPEQSALRDTAVYGMELHPEYFGPYPVPLHTPRGNTVRHKRLLNGVYWIETDQCRELLAVCYPIGQGDLPVMVQEWALQTDYDRTHGIHHTLGYLFFAGRHLCVALFELMQLHRELETNGMVDPAALMNAIWRDNPAYAVVYNLEEALGLHDTFGLLMQQVGVEQELVGSTEQMIVYSPEAGVTFLRFQG